MKNKKIIITILLCSMLFSLFVPLTAFADNQYQLSGVWRFKDTITKNTGINEQVNFTSYNKQWTAMKYDGSMSGVGVLSLKYCDSSSINAYFYQDTNSYMQKEYGNWTREDYLTVDFGPTSQTVTPTFYNWFVSNATRVGDSVLPPTECDGSNCPSTDTNKDNICDDCGLPFTDPRDYTVYYIEAGTYLFNNDILIPRETVSVSTGQFISNYSSGTHKYFYGITFFKDGNRYGLRYDNDASLGDYSGTVVCYSDTGWVDQSYRIVTFSSSIPVYIQEYIWFNDNAVKYDPKCDGSNCPSTDKNKDNICDDCGFPFAEPRDYTVYKTYGSVTLPDIETVWTDKTKFPAMAIYREKSTGDFYLLFGERYVNDYIYNEDLFENNDQCYFKIGDQYFRYKLVDKKWVSVEAGFNSVVARTERTELIWTSHPIYTDSTHTALFFHKASLLVNSLTMKTMAGVLTQVMMLIPMMILLLVGYLGLRKSLKILVIILNKA